MSAGRQQPTHLLVLLLSLLPLAFLPLAYFVPSALAHGETPTELFENVEILFAPYDSSSDVRQDGVVETEEYAAIGHWIDEEEGIHLYLEHDGILLYVAMVNGLGGWVALGFGEDDGEIFDAKVAWWNATLPTIEDRFLSPLTDELETQDDTAGGGTVDVSGFAASLDGGVPVFEFSFPLISEDPRDAALEEGQLHLGFVAFSASQLPFKENLTGADVQFFRQYTLRSTDDPIQILELFQGTAGRPVEAVIAVAIIGLGTTGLAWFLLKKRRRPRG